LRRQWPDALELALEEHVAVARWSPADGEQRLVNSHGEVFAGNVGDELPAFSGPEGTAAAMLARYREFDAQLAKIQHRTTVLTLSARDAWQVRLDDGVLVELGRDQAKQRLAERLARLTDHYVAAREQLKAPIAVVDMRYPNGFALRPGQPDKKSAS
jgi:cell division protein FtsQ